MGSFFTQSEEKIENYRCYYCDELFYSQDELQRHYQFHYFPCIYCKSFHTKSELDKHHDKYHNFPCGFCNKKFYSKEVLEDHLRSHQTILCDYCDKSFFFEVELTKHEDKDHDFPCEYCDDLSFYTKEDLEEHLRFSVHTHLCDYCDREFNSLSAVKQHNDAVHPFPCLVCSKTFRFSGALEDHIDSKHYTAENLEPPVDTDGIWVSRAEIKVAEFKSFGAFECKKCWKKWVSAHSFLQYKQGCKRCNTDNSARFMWVNTSNGKKKDDKDNNNLMDGPHDKERCQACHAGKCISKNRF